jgi:hypothetical protein
MVGGFERCQYRLRGAVYLFVFHFRQYMKPFTQCGVGDGWLKYCGAGASAAGSCWPLLTVPRLRLAGRSDVIVVVILVSAASVVKREALSTLLLLNPRSFPAWLLTNSLRASLPHVGCPYRLKSNAHLFASNRVVFVFGTWWRLDAFLDD